MDDCVLCKKKTNDKDIVKIGVKGSQGINNASSQRNDYISTLPGDVVHKECRRKYCNPHNISHDLAEFASDVDSRTLRSNEPLFLYRENCLFCGQFAKHTHRKRGSDVFFVRTKDFQDTIVAICKERDDEWAKKVLIRVEIAQDLHAADAVYHQSCNVNFRTKKNVPASYQSTSKARRQSGGRPPNIDQNDAFLKLIDYLIKNDDEQITVSDLVQKMKTLCSEEEYSAVYMKKKLKDHFEDTVIFTELNGKANVVTFRHTASSILQKFYQTPKLQDTDEEKMRLIETAAEIIKGDIKSMKDSKTEYPSSDNLSSVDSNIAYIPQTLQTLLRSLFREKDTHIKVASIGQAIMQATRPRVLIAPLQIGLAVQLHHHFASRFLVETLHNLGYCSSYSEVQRYETSAAVSQGTDVLGLTSRHFIQFMADNVDHNIRTLDGHNTFHGMGIIAGITPGIQSNKTVPRLTATSDDLVVLGNIDIQFWHNQAHGTEEIIYRELNIPHVKDPTWQIDLLCKLSWKMPEPAPGWSGIMQMVQKGSYPGKSSFSFLPMIDMNPSDPNCVYSTMVFVCKEAKKYGTDPVLTFDQPLFWKAQLILANEQMTSDLKSIVLRLGGFHLQMSFLGSIGHLMGSSGLNEVLETVYSSNAVGHMMSGKAVSRAVRGHLLVDKALNDLLLSRTFNTETEQNDILSESIYLLDQLLNGRIDAEHVRERIILDELYYKLVEAKSALHKHRTAVLWIQYMDMLDILRKFIKSERTGNWNLHLHSIKDMLPYFASTGHNFYVKSAHIYLQTMQNLETEHPDVYRYFTSGHHVLRRSDRYLAGLSTDLCIEQVLMRSIKTTGGMTRGHGMTPPQRAQWLLSKPACSDLNAAMQEFAQTEFVTSEQHKEVTQARRSKDSRDVKIIHNFLEEHNPFLEDQALRNIATGVIADAKVNVENAKELGNNVLKLMVNKQVQNYTFKKTNQAITLSTKTAVKIGDDMIQVDPQLLFQRLVTAADGLFDDSSDIFTYELCSIPSSLFDSSGFLREAQKPALADAIWALTLPDTDLSNDEVLNHIFDGGSLLQRLPWSHGASFSSICHLYIKHVKKYSNPTVVFDGYTEALSTKDHTHLRRTGGVSGLQVKFTEDMNLSSKKQQFLSNTHNKQRFIDLLSKKMEEAGIHTLHAPGDADLLIVQTAVSSALENVTVLLGEDTDLLVLLLYHADLSSRRIYFKSEVKLATDKRKRVWDIKLVKEKIGLELCRFLPFIHALTGCDTTSRFYGIGKGIALKKLTTNPYFKHQADVFTGGSPSKEEIIRAGEDAITCLYNGFQGEGLNKLRRRKFCAKVTKSTTSVQVHVLPPTSAAAQNHSLRVFLQVQQWIKLDCNLVPQEWGWTVLEGQLHPCQTHLPAAPDCLLKVIRCTCKSDCDNKRCSCRKHGLKCSPGCGNCQGISCSNSSAVIEDDLDDDL